MESVPLGRPSTTLSADLVSEFPPVSDAPLAQPNEEEKLSLPTLSAYSDSTAPNYNSSLMSPREEAKLKEELINSKD